MISTAYFAAARGEMAEILVTTAQKRLEFFSPPPAIAEWTQRTALILLVWLPPILERPHRMLSVA